MTTSSEHLSEQELLFQLESAQKVVEVGALYTHYRDVESRYRVVGLSIIEATQEVGVLYEKEYGSSFLQSFIWVRPLQSWLGKVLIQDRWVPRFQKVK